MRMPCSMVAFHDQTKTNMTGKMPHDVHTKWQIDGMKDDRTEMCEGAR